MGGICTNGGDGSCCVDNGDCDVGYSCTNTQNGTCSSGKACLVNADIPKVTSFNVVDVKELPANPFTITYGGLTSGASVELWRQQGAGAWNVLCNDNSWQANCGGTGNKAILSGATDNPAAISSYTYGLHIIKIVGGVTYVGTETTSGFEPITVEKVACLAAVDCNDADSCSTNSCNAGNQCVFSAYTCEDGNDCTDNACDGAGGCTYPIKAPNTVCSGGRVCNDTGICTSINCLNDEQCNDNNSCTANTCNNDGYYNAFCSYPSLPDNTICGAGQKCYGGSCSTNKCDIGSAYLSCVIY